MISDLLPMISFLQETPEAQRYLFMMLGTTIFIAVLGLTLLAYNRKTENIHWDYDEDLDDYLVCKHEYSKGNMLCVYSSGCRIKRSGVFVSDYMDKILYITSTKDDKNRVLHVEYELPDGKIQKEDIPCGNMDYFEYMCVKELMLEHAQA